MNNINCLADAGFSKAARKAIKKKIASMKTGETVSVRDLHGEKAWQDLGEDSAKQSQGKAFNRLVREGAVPELAYQGPGKRPAVYRKQ